MLGGKENTRRPQHEQHRAKDVLCQAGQPPQQRQELLAQLAAFDVRRERTSEQLVLGRCDRLAGQHLGVREVDVEVVAMEEMVMEVVAMVVAMEEEVMVAVATDVEMVVVAMEEVAMEVVAMVVAMVEVEVAMEEMVMEVVAMVVAMEVVMS